MKIKKVNDLEPGLHYDLTLSLSGNREKRVRGEMIETKRGKCFVAKCSPKESFGGGTIIKEVNR